MLTHKCVNDICYWDYEGLMTHLNSILVLNMRNSYVHIYACTKFFGTWNTKLNTMNQSQTEVWYGILLWIRKLTGNLTYTGCCCVI